MKRINMLKDIEINMLLINIAKCICHLQMFYGAVKVSIPSYLCVTMYTSICYITCLHLIPYICKFVMVILHVWLYIVWIIFFWCVETHEI